MRRISAPSSGGGGGLFAALGLAAVAILVGAGALAVAIFYPGACDGAGVCGRIRAVEARVADGAGGLEVTVGPAESGAKYATLAAGMAAAADLALPTVFVYPGTYAEDVLLDRSMSFVGLGAGVRLGQLTVEAAADAEVAVEQVEAQRVRVAGANTATVRFREVVARSPTAAPAWEVTNSGDGTRLLVASCSGYNLAGGLALDLQLSGAARAEFYGGGQTWSTSNVSAPAIHVATHPDGLTVFSGRVLDILGQVVLDPAGIVSMDRPIIATDGVPGIIVNTPNAVTLINLIFTPNVGGPAAWVIDSTSVGVANLLYLHLVDFTGSGGINVAAFGAVTDLTALLV